MPLPFHIDQFLILKELFHFSMYIYIYILEDGGGCLKAAASPLGKPVLIFILSNLFEDWTTKPEIWRKNAKKSN